MYNGKSDYLFDCVEAGVVSDQPSFFPQQKCLNVNICTVNTFFCLFSSFVIFCKQQGKQRKNAPHPKIFEPFFFVFFFLSNLFWCHCFIYCPSSNLFYRCFFFFLPWLNVPKTKVVFLQLSEADANKVNWHFYRCACCAEVNGNISSFFLLTTCCSGGVGNLSMNFV